MTAYFVNRMSYAKISTFIVSNDKILKMKSCHGSQAVMHSSQAVIAIKLP